MPQQFGAFTASELYCPKCGRSQPVREKLLLVLPTGELHEYLCSRCATSLGKREVVGPALAAPLTAPPRRSAAFAAGITRRLRGIEPLLLSADSLMSQLSIIFMGTAELACASLE